MSDPHHPHTVAEPHRAERQALERAWRHDLRRMVEHALVLLDQAAEKYNPPRPLRQRRATRTP